MNVDSERWHRIDRIFAEVLELDERDRARHLDEACRGDEALRREVESMLRFARESEQFLETPVLADASAAFAELPAPASAEQSRFLPGDRISGRYRIVGLLGRGGMGEVYRADDLKLHQPVALKFLAESLSKDGAALARFHREVSLARQVSHRNVCRVYDIGEHAGMHFLTMEYVRGEELSSLLTRVGRLPLEKAIDTARQLCAGLAAIHGAGVLHRDLKPSNVMIDERGDVRITDFGVAALAEGGDPREKSAGTPAYMAPEQLAAGELTVRTDLYALGLVLFEAFTGRRPFAGGSLEDILRARLSDTPPSTPSTWVADLDPRIERVILRCLERDPGNRPANAMQVAAGLPGGDPLVAALAAGETPSPQMVAAAAAEGSLRPARAGLLLVAILAAIAVVAAISGRISLHRYAPMKRSPELLRDAAQQLVREAGYGPWKDTASGFKANLAVVRYIAEHDSRDDRWERLRTAPLPVIRFWFRTAPHPLVPVSNWLVGPYDPPNDDPAMVRMQFDTEGRLLLFDAEPLPAAPAGQGPAWERFFERAGLAMSRFRPVAPEAIPHHATDARFAWIGVHPLRPELPLRVEAASWLGRPVSFEVIWPWTERVPASEGSSDPLSILLLAVYFGTLAFAVLLAWKNLRLGRGDRRGATRLMLFIFASRMTLWIFLAHHVASSDEVTLLIQALESGVYWAILIGLFYVALEPFIRRRWPEGLISWSRLLAGDLRDPLVGRDILIGGAFGLASALSMTLFYVLPPLAGRPLPRPATGSSLLYEQGLRGVPGFFGLLATQISASIMFPLILITVALFFGMLTRRNFAGIAIVWCFLYAVAVLQMGGPTPMALAVALFVPTIMTVAMTRFGLLALCAAFFFIHVWPFYPVTTDVTAWYATTFLMQAALLIGIALFAFRTSLAGRAVLSDAWLEG